MRVIQDNSPTMLDAMLSTFKTGMGGWMQAKQIQSMQQEMERKKIEDALKILDITGGEVSGEFLDSVARRVGIEPETLRTAMSIKEEMKMPYSPDPEGRSVAQVEADTVYDRQMQAEGDRARAAGTVPNYPVNPASASVAQPVIGGDYTYTRDTGKYQWKTAAERQAEATAKAETARLEAGEKFAQKHFPNVLSRRGQELKQSADIAVDQAVRTKEGTLPFEKQLMEWKAEADIQVKEAERLLKTKNPTPEEKADLELKKAHAEYYKAWAEWYNTGKRIEAQNSRDLKEQTTKLKEFEERVDALNKAGLLVDKKTGNPKTYTKGDADYLSAQKAFKDMGIDVVERSEEVWRGLRSDKVQFVPKPPDIKKVGETKAPQLNAEGLPIGPLVPHATSSATGPVTGSIKGTTLGKTQSPDSSPIASNAETKAFYTSELPKWGTPDWSSDGKGITFSNKPGQVFPVDAEGYFYVYDPISKKRVKFQAPIKG